MDELTYDDILIHGYPAFYRFMEDEAERETQRSVSIRRSAAIRAGLRKKQLFEEERNKK